MFNEARKYKLIFLLLKQPFIFGINYNLYTKSILIDIN